MLNRPGLQEAPFVERMGIWADQAGIKQVFPRGKRASGSDGLGELENQGEHGSQWAAIGSMASEIGCTSETLRKWVRQAERDGGRRPGLTTEERQRLKELERQNKELRRANEILRKASVFFAQAELDRQRK